MDIKPIIMMEDNTHQLTPVIQHVPMQPHHHQTQNDVDDGSKVVSIRDETIETEKNNDTSHLNNNDQNDQTNDDLRTDTSAMNESINKTPNSYKYPLLKRYYEFGPWVGRNRKAICLGCRLQTSSSQPDRLLKHLNRCAALTEQDKVAVQELMNERTANKRKKPMHLKLKDRDGNESTDYFTDGDHHMNDDLALSTLNSSQNCNPRGARLRQADRSERDCQIDEALTRFIMMCRIPLKAIHSPEFIELVRQLNADYHIPSRETITNVLIPGLLNII